MIPTDQIVTKDGLPVHGDTDVHQSDVMKEVKDDDPQALVTRGDVLHHLAEDLLVLDTDVHLSQDTDVRPAPDTDAHPAHDIDDSPVKFKPGNIDFFQLGTSGRCATKIWFCGY